MHRAVFVLSLFGLLTLSSCLDPTIADDQNGPGASLPGASNSGDGPRKVIKSDAEWARILPRDVYWVTRQKGTEPAGSGKYAHYKGKGIFACYSCGSELFDARTKFESGTGWPSFYQPIRADRVTTEQDFSMTVTRVEVLCSTCDAHLGHVFGDGPPPTGLRFCMNSAALKLVKPEPPSAKPKPATRAKGAAAKPATGAKSSDPK